MVTRIPALIFRGSIGNRVFILPILRSLNTVYAGSEAVYIHPIQEQHMRVTIQIQCTRYPQGIKAPGRPDHWTNVTAPVRAAAAWLVNHWQRGARPLKTDVETDTNNQTPR
jgi:hypothetical protein